MSTEISIKAARQHIEDGEAALREARLPPTDSTAVQTALYAEATAHFTAAMAITNILLADETEQHFTSLLPAPSELWDPGGTCARPTGRGRWRA